MIVIVQYKLSKKYLQTIAHLNCFSSKVFELAEDKKTKVSQLLAKTDFPGIKKYEELPMHIFATNES